MEENLPKGWVETDLGSLVHLLGGFAFKSKDYVSQQRGFPIIRMGNISKNFCIVWNLKKQVYFPKDRKGEVEKYLLSPNDLLICLTDLSGKGEYLGTVALMDKNVPAFLNQRVSKFIFPESLLDKKFLFYQLRSFRFRTYMTEDISGTLQRNTNHSYIQAFRFLLPPLPEQNRIVAKLDTLFASLDSTKARLEKIPQLLKNFRQAVLTQAVTGKLTEEWREGRELGEWEIRKLGDLLLDVKYGTSKKSDYKTAGVPILRIPNIKEGKIDDADLKYSKLDEKEFEKLKLKKGDVLIIRSNGSLTIVGRSAIIGEKHSSWAYAGYLVRLRPCSKIIGNYLNFLLKSNELREQIVEKARSTNGVNNINSQEIKDLEIPFTSLEEQHEIVRRVESLFAKADAIEQQYQKLKEKVDTLPQAILAKAFRGELVPQNPLDEPAAKLLERIRTEKEKMTPKGKRKKRK